MSRWGRVGPKLTGLRARTASALAVGGLLVSLVLGFITYEVGRSFFVNQRTQLATETAFLHAEGIDISLLDTSVSVDDVLAAQSDTNSAVLLRRDDTWFGAVVGVGESDVSSGVRDAVRSGLTATRVRGGDDPAVVVGIPLPNSDVEFYEIFPLGGLESTLSVLRNVLIGASLVASLTGALFGLVISRRVLAPLRVTAHAAERIASGELGTRLPEEGDPDLSPLSSAFNDMASSLESRVQRERRFAADVSHELRTPLAALGSAVSVLSRRTGGMSPTGREAFGAIEAQIDHFNDLVLEILDLSRMEAGIADVQVEAINVRRFLESTLEEHHLPASVIDLSTDAPVTILSDPRRLRVVFRNIVENAARYAGGIERVGVSVRGEMVRFEFDDRGPGLTRAERSEVFERFRRGSAPPAPDAPRGTGLGLAMAVENVRLLNGRIEAAEAPIGGARFVVEVRSSSSARATPEAGPS